MAIRERGSAFQVSVTIAGKRYRKDFPNKVAAGQAEAQATLAAGQGLPPPWATPAAPGEITAHATWQDVLNASAVSDWGRARTSHDMVTAGQRVINAIGAQSKPAALDEDALEALVDGWYKDGNTGSTINRKLSILRTLTKRAARKVPGMVIPKMPWQRENSMRLRYFTRDEERRIIEFFATTGEPLMADLVALGFDTGARRSEMLALTARSLQEGGQAVKLTTYKGGERGRLVPLTARAKEILRRRIELHPTGSLFPITPNRVGYTWIRMRDFLGFAKEEDFVFHCIRHSYASRLVQAGVQIQVVQNLMGHANIMMTMRYAHLAPDNLRAAVAALEAAGTATTPCPPAHVVPSVGTETLGAA